MPDERLQKLSDIVGPQRIVPTTVDIVDIAGLIKGASQGEGLGNQFLGNIREVDAIIHVVRCFDDDNVIHVDGEINPIRDKDIIDTELLLKDMETLEKRIDKLKKTAKSGNKEDKASLEFVSALYQHLEQENSARSFAVSELHIDLYKELYLLTAKPILYVCNVDENSAKDGNEYSNALSDHVKNENAEVILISASIEEEIIQLDTDEERLMFLEEMGLSQPGVNRLIKSCYTLLRLITYFTAGEKEVRAWTVKEGSTAPSSRWSHPYRLREGIHSC